MYEYKTKGTCSQKIFFDIEDNKVKNVQFVGGCNGNLKGIGKLVEGMDVDDVIARIEGVKCGMKSTSCPDQLAQALKNCSVPVVVTGQRFPDVACVYNDDHTAARELTQRMLEHGRRRIVYIGGSERDDATGIQRREGVQDALRDAGLDGDQLPRICCNAFTVEEGQRCMQELLTRCPFLDGVVCVTDTVAFGAMHALKQAGRQIGRDVGLAGIGDSWAGSVTDPGLATVRFYQKQVGQEAARILLQMLEEKEHGGPVRQVTLGYQVVERGSL